MPAPRFGEPEQSATDGSGGRKKIPWAILLVAMLIFLGGYVAVIAYVRLGGQAVKDFCGQEWVGRSPTEAKELAIRSGLEIIEREGSVRVTTNPRKSRHTCELKVEAGKVKSAKAFFRF